MKHTYDMTAACASRVRERVMKVIAEGEDHRPKDIYLAVRAQLEAENFYDVSKGVLQLVELWLHGARDRVTFEFGRDLALFMSQGFLALRRGIRERQMAQGTLDADLELYGVTIPDDEADA